MALASAIVMRHGQPSKPLREKALGVDLLREDREEETEFVTVEILFANR